MGKNQVNSCFVSVRCCTISRSASPAWDQSPAPLRSLPPRTHARLQVTETLPNPNASCSTRASRASHCCAKNAGKKKILRAPGLSGRGRAGQAPHKPRAEGSTKSRNPAAAEDTTPPQAALAGLPEPTGSVRTALPAFHLLARPRKQGQSKKLCRMLHVKLLHPIPTPDVPRCEHTAHEPRHLAAVLDAASTQLFPARILICFQGIPCPHP